MTIAPSKAEGKKAQPKKAPSTRRITFGSVTVEGPAPNESELRRNVKAGQRALERALKVIVTPGVKLDLPKGVARYHADPDHPGRLVRVLKGKTDRGVFINGKFKKTVAG